MIWLSLLFAIPSQAQSPVKLLVTHFQDELSFQVKLEPGSIYQQRILISGRRGIKLLERTLPEGCAVAWVLPWSVNGDTSGFFWAVMRSHGSVGTLSGITSSGETISLSALLEWNGPSLLVNNTRSAVSLAFLKPVDGRDPRLGFPRRYLCRRGKRFQIRSKPVAP